MRILLLAILVLISACASVSKKPYTPPDTTKDMWLDCNEDTAQMQIIKDRTAKRDELLKRIGSK
jgi:hypothetical protein